MREQRPCGVGTERRRARALPPGRRSVLDGPCELSRARAVQLVRKREEGEDRVPPASAIGRREIRAQGEAARTEVRE